MEAWIVAVWGLRWREELHSNHAQEEVAKSPNIGLICEMWLTESMIEDWTVYRRTNPHPILWPVELLTTQWQTDQRANWLTQSRPWPHLRQLHPHPREKWKLRCFEGVSHHSRLQAHGQWPPRSGFSMTRRLLSGFHRKSWCRKSQTTRGRCHRPGALLPLGSASSQLPGQGMARRTSFSFQAKNKPNTKHIQDACAMLMRSNQGLNLLAFYLAFCLAFYLAYLLAFYLAYLLTFYLANFLAFSLAYLLAFYLAYLLTFYLAYLLAFYLAYLIGFYLAYLLAFYLTFYLAIWPLRSSGAHWAGQVPGWGPAGRSQVEVQRCTLSWAGPRLRSSGAHWAGKVSGWGPAVPTELGRSQVEVQRCPLSWEGPRLRSSGAHWARTLAKSLAKSWQGNSGRGSGGRGGGGDAGGGGAGGAGGW